MGNSLRKFQLQVLLMEIHIEYNYLQIFRVSFTRFTLSRRRKKTRRNRRKKSNPMIRTLPRSNTLKLSLRKVRNLKK